MISWILGGKGLLNEWMNESVNERQGHTGSVKKPKGGKLYHRKFALLRTICMGQKTVLKTFLKSRVGGCTFKQRDMVVEVVWYPSLPEYK